ncbi:hypothetical protein [Methanosphaera cuniculi]|uniref:hypothetical protein n=1 Tax=Methanosphaera cuniculi TaxID=1077256 RepID=UPI0026EB4DE1|nr:hypothetical protein [Methanosphaera cuniculi]
MRIITTPMCKDLLDIAGIDNYNVVMPNEIKDADVVITLSETKCDIDKIPVKLNSFTQLYDSIMTLKNEFNTQVDLKRVNEIYDLIQLNDQNKAKRCNIKVKVYSNFLKDTITDMGYQITDEDYDYIVVPDYMNDIKLTDNTIVVSSHKNVSRNIIKRLKSRYELLENKLCMQQ